MQQLYFRNSFVDMYYDLDLNLGKAVWNGKLVGAEFREVTLMCLEMLDRFELTRWLGDNRNMKPISPEDLQWSLEVFVPKLLCGPLLRMATLPSKYEENRQAVNMLMSKSHDLDNSLELRDFQNEEEAMAWLLQEAPSVSKITP
ncbi:hypothetical protein [Pontibacter oryzae]|uniref:STAS/SEC14 domain-containing protein n=1 Tax=Pontibacter oryzae TaxID=2304593 RepID=A0A399S4P4_9BACT|nr:hypothetical protein [Pontibacter oryzae]RIJ37559.1 hypothetical protein D1627_10635 [Pontibacter oryzae]